MNILLVSQCRKNALKETRRILDQFAERRGERTWQTPITRAGLDTLRKMLRRTARKNTAVACHWIRGTHNSELLWIVGDASQFNVHGAVATHTTRNDILRRADENDWHTLTDIHLLASLAALFHDFGKACLAFQNKLKGKDSQRNRFRHEWISLRLLQAFVGEDDDNGWLTRLHNATQIDEKTWLSRLRRDGLDERQPPLADLPPIAKFVGWLIISHHRLPVLPSESNGQQLYIGKKSGQNAASIPTLPDGIKASWNEIDAPDDAKLIKPYWQFPEGLPSRSQAWCKRARRLARQALNRQHNLAAVDLHNIYALHIARLCLMLADHHYSSLSEQALHRPTSGDKGFPLFANTAPGNKLAQRLDDHLLGVTREVGAIAHRLPDTIAALPRLARHKGFRKRSKNARFRWQDKAFDLAAALRERSQQHGFFGINMASTGCGKTLANGRICYALAEPERGARFTIALGLRTLTLQTGAAYRQDLNLGSDDLAIRVGGQANRVLFKHNQAEQEQTDQLDAQGKASAEPLFDGDGHVHFDGQIDNHPLLSRVVRNPQARALITAPILTCTIDHLMPATESLRGGSQIAPMLRLMGADLILDEPDDFGLKDMPALTRLVYMTGLLGSRVLLSSATLPPAMVEGLYRAYRAGREQYQKNRGEPGLPVNICCAWFDEYGSQHHDCPDSATFRTQHDNFAQHRAKQLAKARPRRRARIAPLGFTPRQHDKLAGQFATELLQHALGLHDDHHETDPKTGHRVSFGLIRMANIGPLLDVARALYAQDAPEDVRIHLCVYHSQFPLLLRSAIENRLDAALDRRRPETVYELADIRRHLDISTEPDQLFIVLGSPVTEVGRDHDYDWAVVEPSSMRSIIQLAGRVRRHRISETEHDNIILLDRNWRAIDTPGQRAFTRPGFEGGGYSLASHRLQDLLHEDDYAVIDSRPRLQARQPLDATHNLADLEHARLRDALLAPAAPQAPTPPPSQPQRGRRRRRSTKPAPPSLDAHSAYSRQELWQTGIQAQQRPFREQSTPQIELVLLPDEDETDFQLVRSEPQRYGPPIETNVEDRFNHRIAAGELQAQRITPWANTDYMSELLSLATARDMDLTRCARTFGTLQMDDHERGWLWHPWLGFGKKQG